MTATKQRIATIKGTFAVPGVSKNRRLYTREAIAEAVAEGQKLIESGQAPVVAMLTHHGARDPSSGSVANTAGQVTKLAVTPEGHGTFEADIADTGAGRDVAALTTPDHPYLKGVSMASMWTGTPHTVSAPDGSGPCETADGFSLKGIDFTHNPGVDGAQIHSAELSESAPADLICEELEEVVFVEQTDGRVPVTEAAKPTPGSNYADPGYQADNKERYPLDTAKKVRAAWAYINQADNAKPYTATQLKRIKGKIKKAAKTFDIQIAEEMRLLGTEILEAYASVCLDNGPGTVSVSGYTNEPEQLAQIGQRVAMAALAGLYQLDPDCDGDIDLLNGDGSESDDDDEMGECPSCNSDVPAGALYCPTCGQPVPQGESAPNKEGATMPTDAKDKGAANESTLSMTQTQLDEAVAAGAKAALEAAGIKPAPEPIVESDEVKAARKLVEEADAAKAANAETPAAPAANEAATFTAEQVKTMVEEAAAASAKTATEAALDVARKEIQEAGPRRRGLVPKSIMEQSSDEVYGEVPLKDMSLADLEKATDSAMTPLLAS